MLHSRLAFLCSALLYGEAHARLWGAALNGTTGALPTRSPSPQHVSSSSTSTPPSSSSLSSSSSSTLTSITIATSYLSSPSSDSSAWLTSSITAQTGSGSATSPVISDSPPSTADLDFVASSQVKSLPSSTRRGGRPLNPDTFSLYTTTSIPHKTPFQGPSSSSTTTSIQYNSGSTISPSNITTITTPTASPTPSYQNTTTPTTSLAPSYQTTVGCIPYTPGDPITKWSIVPNTTTVTITLYPNQTNTYTTLPEWTTPLTCAPTFPESSTQSSSTIIPPGFVPGGPHHISSSTPDITIAIEPFTQPAATPVVFSVSPKITPPVTTVVVTAKNPVTLLTTEKNPPFPGGTIPPPKIPAPAPAETGAAGLPEPVTTSAIITSGSGGLPNKVGTDAGGGSATNVSPTTVNIGGVTVVVGPSSVVIGGVTLTPSPSPGSGASVVTEGGETFTVNPSQVIGPGTVVSIPTTGGAGVFLEQSTPTLPGSLPTNVVVFDAQVFSVVGGSVAVFDGSSFTFTGGTPQTTVFNGATITAGPSGFVDGTQTLGGPSHPSGTQFGIAGGITISEVGSTQVVIDGTTLAVGAGAPQVTATINSYTISAGPSGLGITDANGASTSLNGPFNPTPQAVTAGGITFSEIGSSLVDIGGTTYTIGPGAPATTEVYNSQTIILGPGGVGFATTTITSLTTASPTAATSTKKKSGAPPAFRAGVLVLGICIAFGVGVLV